MFCMAKRAGFVLAVMARIKVVGQSVWLEKPRPPGQASRPSCFLKQSSSFAGWHIPEDLRLPATTALAASLQADTTS